MKTITHLTPIKRYEGPQWFVEPVEGLGERWEAEEIAALYAEGFSVIETTVMGWGDYNAIIRSNEGIDYLAKLEEKADRGIRTYTKSGEYVVFHSGQARSTGIYETGWHFEPAYYPYGDVFSEAYETPEAALQAAEAWEVEAEREAESELGADLEEE